MVQWIPTRSDTEYKLIMRSFLKVFPNATLWAGGNIMVGSKQPLVLDRAAFERKLENAQARTALQADGITDFNAIVSQYTSGPDEMRAFAGQGPLLTDDPPAPGVFPVPECQRAAPRHHAAEQQHQPQRGARSLTEVFNGGLLAFRPATSR